MQVNNMYDLLSQELTELVKNIDSRHPDDPDVTKWLHQMADLITNNEQKTIAFFRDCGISHERIIYWLSPFFDDLANEFSSDEMIESIKSLITKYPKDTGLSNDVKVAIEIMYRMRDTSGDLDR
jgi:hypothetical protein